MLTKPTIHLNGSSAKSLADGYQHTWLKIEEAVKAISEIYPHGRDYYPQGDDAINKALKEHQARIDILRKLQEELVVLWEHVNEQAKR